MADLVKWFKDRGKQAQGVYHQANPFDGGRTYDTNQRNVNPGTPNPVNIKDDNTPGFQWSNNSVTRGISRAYDQVNMNDNNRTWKQRTPTTQRSTLQQLGHTGKQIGKPFWETGDYVVQSAQVGLHNAFGDPNSEEAQIDRQKRDQSYQESLLPPVMRASWQLQESLPTEKLLGRTPTQRAEKQIEEAYQNAINSGVPKEAADNAKNQALSDWYNYTLNKAGFTMDDSAAKMYLKSFSDLGTTASYFIAPASGASVNTVKAGATEALTNGLFSGITNAAGTAGNGGTAEETLGSFGLGFGTGATMTAGGYVLPKMIKGGQQVVKGTPENVVRVKNAIQNATDISNNPSLVQINEHINTLNTLRDKMVAAGMSEKAPAMVQNKNAYADAVKLRSDITNSIKQGGYVKIGKGDPFEAEINNLKVSSSKPSKNLPKVTEDTTPQPPLRVSRQSKATVDELPVKDTRFTSKTLQGSQEVSEGVKKSVKEAKPTYVATTDAERIANSEQYLRKTGIKKATADINDRLVDKNIDSQTVSDAIAVAKKLDSQGTKASQLAATEIYEKLGVKLSESGQAVQAASLLNNRTPEGLKFGAVNTLRKSGVKITPEIEGKLNELISAVKKTKADTYEGGLARFKVAEFVEKNVPHSTADKGIQLWKAGLLSAPRTTAGNLFANTAETVFKKGYVDPVATMTDQFFSLFTGKRSRSMTGKGIASGAAEGVDKGFKYFKTGYDPRNPMQKFDIKNVHFSDTPLGKAAETYTQGVFKLMGSQDQPFYYANLRNSIYDQAITEAKNQGLKGMVRKDFIKKFVEQPETKVLELADKEARYAVFQNETALGKAASRVKGMDGAAGNIAEFVMPFSGVPSSIATRIIERTPVGTAIEIVKQLKAGKFDQRAMTQAIANGTAAVPLIAAGSALASNNLMTLGYPKDKKERELWEADGRQPYSIKLGDTWISLNYFQPGGTLIAAGAEYQNAIKDGKTPTEALSAATAGAGKAVTDQSFLKGVSGGLNALTDPQYAGEKFLDQTAGSLTPNIIRSVASATDSKQRETNNITDTMKSTIPGVRQTLDPKRDIFGRDVPRRSDAVNSLLNPLRPSDSINKDDFVLSELKRLQAADNGLIPTQLQKNAFNKDGEGKNLTDKQVQDFNAEAGSKIREEWAKVVNDSRYTSMSDEDKNTTLKKINDDVYGALKRRYEAENNVGQYDPNYKGKQEKLSTGEKRYLEGKATDYLLKNSTDRTPQEEYDYQVQKLEEDKSTLNGVEIKKRETEIKRLGVNKNYDKEIVDLYSMNKDDIIDYLDGSKDSDKKFNDLMKYGDELVSAGLINKNKFRDKNGKIVKEKSKKSGSSKKSGRFTAPKSGGVSQVSSTAAIAKLLGQSKTKLTARAVKKRV